MLLLHKHDWFIENAYYVDSDFGSEFAGRAKVCLKCGKIVKKGNAQMPKRFEKYRNNILNGREWWKYTV